MISLKIMISEYAPTTDLRFKSMSCSSMLVLGHVFEQLQPVVPSDMQLPLSASWSSSSSALWSSLYNVYRIYRYTLGATHPKQIPKCKHKPIRMLRHPSHPPRLQSSLVPFWSTCPKHPSHVVTKVSLHKANKGRNSGWANILLLVGCSTIQKRDCRMLCETSTR